MKCGFQCQGDDRVHLVVQLRACYYREGRCGSRSMMPRRSTNPPNLGSLYVLWPKGLRACTWVKHREMGRSPWFSGRTQLRHQGPPKRSQRRQCDHRRRGDRDRRPKTPHCWAHKTKKLGSIWGAQKTREWALPRAFGRHSALQAHFIPFDPLTHRTINLCCCQSLK